MKFHVLGLAHTQTNISFNSCAFTMKVFNMCRMLADLGHEVIHYGNEGSSPVCDEQVDILNIKEFEENYPTNLKHDQHYQYDRYDVGWTTFLLRIEEELKKRIKDKKQEFILVFFGNFFKSIEEKDLAIFVEAGIGYEGFFAKYKVFESYYWMATCLAKRYGASADGDFFSVRIPNYFDPEMFRFRRKKNEYFLFIGRLIKRKGIEIIKQLSRKLDIKIKVAGTGDLDLLELDKYPNIEYLGNLDVEKRKKWLSEAKALIAPTLYIEPFGGVVVEAMLSGTPAITTDWGAFTETVLHGITGFRCRSLSDFSSAIQQIDEIKPDKCKKWAMNFSTNRIRDMYQNYFEKVLDYENGKDWLSFGDNIENPLEWLKVDYIK